jgi:magnesium-protoporphyrin IX monomethyl ester (oxidative) cyclase
LAKVLLINPSSPEFAYMREKHIPLGVLYISAYLKKNGHDVLFIDASNDQIIADLEGKGFDLPRYCKSKVNNVILSFKPDMIGITVHFSGRFHPSIEISKFIKEKFSHIPIVFGGIHPSIFPKEIMAQYSCVDFILQGESESTLVELVNAIEKTKYDFNKIDGLCYRSQEKIFLNKKERFIENIDNVFFPDYDLVNIKDYYFDTSHWVNPKKIPINLSLHIVSSRSCPRRCTFCSMFIVHGPKYRVRSASNIVDEIDFLCHKFGHSYFSFMDDNLTLDKQRAIEICNEIIKRGLNIQFDTPNGLDLNTLDEDVIEALIRAGLIRACFAIESGSEEIRKSINKNLSTERIFEVYRSIEKYPHLIYNTFFVIGFPNETRKTLDETYQLIKQLKLKKAIISFATPFPGTKLYDECAANKLIEMDLNNFHDIDNLCYTNKMPFIKPYNLEKQDLINFRFKVYKELNMQKQLDMLDCIKK